MTSAVPEMERKDTISSNTLEKTHVRESSENIKRNEEEFESSIDGTFNEFKRRVQKLNFSELIVDDVIEDDCSGKDRELEKKSLIKQEEITTETERERREETVPQVCLKKDSIGRVWTLDISLWVSQCDRCIRQKLMFGRPPRLAIDAFIGLKRQHVSGTSPSDYMQKLEQQLCDAYQRANDAAIRSGERGKKYNDQKDCNSCSSSADRYRPPHRRGPNEPGLLPRRIRQKPESTKKIISCKTSECRPKSQVQWYLRNSTGQDENNLTQSSTPIYINGEYGLKSVENPPDNSPVKNGSVSSNIIQVIESDTVTFVCSESGGNPLASLNWNCFDSHDLTVKTQEVIVLSTVKWTKLDDYSTCFCTSNHVLSNLKRTANVTVNVQCVWTNMIQLTPTRLYAVENSSATLTCSKTNGIISESIWFNSQMFGDANLYYSDGQCVTSRFLRDSDLFSGVCNNNGTYSVVLKKIDRTQHGAEWMCVELLSMSNKVVIEVSVPATSVTLSQQNGEYMKENQDKNISCITPACRPDPRVQWYLRNGNNQIIYNVTQFSTNRYVNSEYGLRAVNSVLHLRPNRTINNLRLYCEVRTRFDKADILSRDVIVNVTYPPDISPVIHGVETNDPLSVIVSDKGAFVCSVTGGNPLASLEWNCFDSQDITMNTQESTVTSTVKWTALRNYSTCSCTSHHTLSNWKRITNLTVHVQFPPTKPHFKIGQTDVFGVVRVIQNNTLRVACYSESNPLSNYTWIGPGFFSDKGDTIEITSVKLSNQGNYKCVASNRMIRTNGSYEDGSHTSSLNLTVLYPPSKPKFKFENSSGQLIQSNIFYVVRNDTFSIYCDVKGNPDPDIKWDDNKSNPRLSISNIYLDINSTCRATNLMKEFASQIEIISKSEAPFSIIVLYPPGPPTIHVSNDNATAFRFKMENVSIIESETINVKCFSTNPAIVNGIDDVSIVEGSQLETVCPVVYGNPSTSIVTWSRQGEASLSNNRLLFIKNVSRADNAMYTCSVITEMFPTIGTDLKAERRNSFHLNVFFPSEINKFTISTVSSGRTFLVNETQKPYFECIAEANPPPDLKIKSPRGDYIIEVSQSNIARHTFLRSATYKDAGEYICSGRNNYTTDSPSQSKLILIVKSQPRPSSGDTSVMKVATVLNVDVTLPFIALNYLDEPNKTMFRWFKDNVSIPDNDNKYLIHSNDLQTNITIKNTTQRDLGLYKVDVENSVGMYTQYYELKATDKPERPKDFSVMNDSITDTMVTLAWSPGFNGGFQQTFVILYKIMQEHIWLNKSIKDNGDFNMNYTLNDLSSLQEYEIEMFARNIEGHSFHTNRLHFKTKATIKKTKETIGSSNTGAFVGVGVGASAVTLAIVAVSFFGYKRFRNIRSSQRESPKQGVTAGSHVSSNYTELDASRREINNYDDFNVAYEHLNASTREPNTYMELKNTHVLNADTSDYVNIRI
ncbi:hemicentin-1-like [Ruditapes philippinarum]|uniref:hemicentin-1-like n=1 Tax=Ruditapes philippinarum TaxID=129788 RepID=UPI00295A923F|nr:hemicentin-1-like [Ruditapes philippinarum]